MKPFRSHPSDLTLPISPFRSHMDEFSGGGHFFIYTLFSYLTCIHLMCIVKYCQLLIFLCFLNLIFYINLSIFYKISKIGFNFIYRLKIVIDFAPPIPMEKALSLPSIVSFNFSESLFYLNFTLY